MRTFIKATTNTLEPEGISSAADHRRQNEFCSISRMEAFGGRKGGVVAKGCDFKSNWGALPP
jgi:hypothetical protein